MTTKKDPAALTLAEFTEFLNEIRDQPAWRAKADREMDYADGNQLDGELLQRQKSLGIPPAVENLIGPALLSVAGYESVTRTDWRVTPDGDTDGQDVADAINFKLNKAERHSRADKAVSAAFKSMVGSGIGWVEVSRESDPFRYPYRCAPIHRNEIFWDMLARESDLSDARYLVRKRWMDSKRIALAFPEHKDLIEHSYGRWTDRFDITMDGSSSTGLAGHWSTERGWSVEEQEWYNSEAKRACVFEVWYRRWESVLCITTPDGRTVEYDENNNAHVFAAAQPRAKVFKAVTARIRRSYWMGPHCLHDGASPYSHRHFGYVPFWCFAEDRTGVPFGLARGMMYQQDALNSGISKMRWAMSSVRTERTDGAIAMSDAQFRQQIGRVDADIVLDATHMARPGAMFKVHRDFQMTDQQHQMLQDARAAIERVSAVAAAFRGQKGTATSGLQEQTQVEQANQTLASIMDNRSAAREIMGEMLMSFIIEDMGENENTVIIEGDAITEDRTVTLNAPAVDPATGVEYRSNDVQRTRLKVALAEVPSTNSYRAQQLNALSESVKSLPPNYQAAMLPFMVSLMDIPFKEKAIEAIKAVEQQQTPEQIQEQIQQAVQDALAKAGNENRARELDIREREAAAREKLLQAQTVQTGVQASFSAMQAGAQIAQMPQIAPVADAVMMSAGYTRPARSDDPDFPIAQAPMPAEVMPPVNQNTSPTFPPIPNDGESAMDGIETANPEDNLV